jgi:hypothetical protein
VAKEEIKDRIDRYFSFYRERAKNLQNLSRTNEIEAGLLALCYLDALSESARRHGINDAISTFSRWRELPGLVSLGRLYKFVEWLSTLPEPTEENKFLSKELEDQLWRSDAHAMKKIVKELVALYSRDRWTLFLTALEEFTRKKLGQEPREVKLFLRAQSIDLPPNDLVRELTEYISRGPVNSLRDYFPDHPSNRERFAMLIENENTDQLEQLFGFFTFSNVFRRDYRNPMVHKTGVPSRGRDWAEKVNEPYYWFSPAGVNELAVHTEVPFRFFVETFVECLNNYEGFCRSGARDPTPSLPEI